MLKCKFKIVSFEMTPMVESEARAVARRAKWGYTLRVVREVRWVFFIDSPVRYRMIFLTIIVS